MSRGLLVIADLINSIVPPAHEAAKDIDETRLALVRLINIVGSRSIRPGTGKLQDKALADLAKAAGGKP